MILLPELRRALQSDDGEINHQRREAVERAVEVLRAPLRMLIIDVAVLNRRQPRQRWDEKPVEIDQRVSAVIDQNISMLQVAMRRAQSVERADGVKPLVRQMPQMLFRIGQFENALDVDIQGRALNPIHNQDRIPFPTDDHAIRHVLKPRQWNDRGVAPSERRAPDSAAPGLRGNRGSTGSPWRVNHPRHLA